MEFRTLAPAEQLDFILKEIRKTSEVRHREAKKFNEFCKTITPDPNIDHQYMRSVLDRLIQDGYLKEAVREFEDGSRHMFAITFDGVALLDVDGGYSGKIQTADSERTYIRKLELENHKLQRRTVTLAVVGALTGIGSLLLSLWMYAQDHYPYFPCWECIGKYL